MKNINVTYTNDENGRITTGTDAPSPLTSINVLRDTVECARRDPPRRYQQPRTWDYERRCGNPDRTSDKHLTIENELRCIESKQAIHTRFCCFFSVLKFGDGLHYRNEGLLDNENLPAFRLRQLGRRFEG